MAPVTFSLGFLFALLVSASPAPDPAAVTAAAVLPRSPALVAFEKEFAFRQYVAYQERSLVGRQLKPGMSVCFGSDAICSLSLDLSCSASLEGDEWYKCYCTSGKVALNAACQNCQDLYDLGGSFSIEDWEGYCSEKNFDIAPIPASFISSWSKFNATMTYSTALPTTAGSGSGAASNTAKTTSSGTKTGSTASTLSRSGSGLTSLSSSRRSGSIDETLTLVGNPTGTWDPTPLTTTTGIPPLQATTGGSSGAGRLGREGDGLRIVSLGMIGATLLLGTAFML